MIDDDRSRGTVLRRRDALALLGGLGALAATGSYARAAGAVPGCVVRPEQTEGPFFVDSAPERVDIGDGMPGTPLRLAFRLSRIVGGSCSALVGARVDAWHCDAAGRYSGVGGRGSAAGLQFLRGSQVSDAAGIARFMTIFPGWYPGRAVHVHFKIRSIDPAGRGQEFTSQLYFDDALNRRVFATGPYAARRAGWMRNSDDGIYRSGGRQWMPDVVANAADAGFDATLAVALAMG
ncbi:MAG: intradiol ring-cleavage dioxygenase [Betaproteobacteria bacterium]